MVALLLQLFWVQQQKPRELDSLTEPTHLLPLLQSDSEFQESDQQPRETQL